LPLVAAIDRHIGVTCLDVCTVRRDHPVAGVREATKRGRQDPNWFLDIGATS
jgi:hypothetical protein